MDIREYVIRNTQRGECKCGQCIDVGTRPDPQGHTIDMAFFKVALADGAKPTAEEFKKLTDAHRGEYAQVKPFDGKAHDYTELGAWIGDQGLAMQYMALGVLLEQFILIPIQGMLAIVSMEAVKQWHNAAVS